MNNQCHARLWKGSAECIAISFSVIVMWFFLRMNIRAAHWRTVLKVHKGLRSYHDSHPREFFYISWGGGIQPIFYFWLVQTQWYLIHCYIQTKERVSVAFYMISYCFVMPFLHFPAIVCDQHHGIFRLRNHCFRIRRTSYVPVLSAQLSLIQFQNGPV